MDPTQPNSIVEYRVDFQGIAQIITWVLVIIGWLIVNSQHNKRISRKETRDRLDQMGESLLKLEQVAIEYHTAKKRNDKLACSIRTAIERVSRAINRLGLATTAELNPKIIDLRRAITLQNFDSRKYERKDPSGEFIDRISHSTGELIDLLESKYLVRYPQS